MTFAIEEAVFNFLASLHCKHSRKLRAVQHYYVFCPLHI
jgi:hypothetical protein